MCMDFTHLNKTYPKDSYMLPNINQLVDNALGFVTLSFSDTFTVYNQLKIHLDDEDKTTFITNEGIYYYKVVLFELKNAGAIY